MVLEQHELIGSETSSRNSEVIHAGIYYPPGSLRARAVRRGQGAAVPLLRATTACRTRAARKLLVATQREPAAQARRHQGDRCENGVHGSREH